MDKRAKVYLFELAAAVGITVVTVVIQKALTRPDFGRTLGMRVSLGVKRFADSQADVWSEVAGKAAQTYNGFKL